MILVQSFNSLFIYFLLHFNSLVNGYISCKCDASGDLVEILRWRMGSKRGLRACSFGEFLGLLVP